ncbi:class I SAM-dependent methyltransferase [Mucilaginibacter sabulilitoris]|uniref:Class I SAM-dependent methyltransferase n=1 Tax=Mucilaginibacter sabulilitoris TaxID=1173583 RepID=A0ABZ0TEN7_9SPHI|nr:class I SAM-dependent methyltransferase [Mucilaginibacter sabulilitoris]WPU91646.1 class I SAM-dependent methyltransferase [Mucilaginibacter sabulilitoris]
MKKLLSIKGLKSIFHILKFRIQLRLLKSVIRDTNAWLLFDQAGIAGFGVNLIRLYFPIYYDKKESRASFSAPVEKQFSEIFDNADTGRFQADILVMLQEIIQLPVKETHSTTPYLDNYYFGIYDASVLGTMMMHFKPSKIVEIGSGMSTRYMKLFKTRLGLTTEICCIDPFPRTEIENVADSIFRQPLEHINEREVFDLKSGDIIFMDGSHYTFQGNDTLTLFFKLLPSLPPGVIIHIHDIFLPYDYSDKVAQQLWSEQYLLAALLSGGFRGLRVLYPAYYLSKTAPVIKDTLAGINRSFENTTFACGPDHTEGYSFWFKKI